MALKGTLKDFSLADIFQLIGIQKKTGVLTLKSDKEVVTVSFVEGNVVSADALNNGGFRVGADLEVYEPVGCGRCNRSGYRGRIGLFSVMSMSERIKDLTVTGAPEAEITEAAREEGMQTLREDGLRKIRAGVTSVAEVARVST